MSIPSSPQAQQRFARLPLAISHLASNREIALQTLAAAPSMRVYLANHGFSPAPKFGVNEYDACIALIGDAIGVFPLSDGDFEYALRLATSPEDREVAP